MPYAWNDPNGDPIEVNGPIELPDRVVTPQWLQQQEPDDLLEMGFVWFDDSPAPLDRVALGAHLTRAPNGTVTRLWETRAYTAQERTSLRQAAIAAVKAEASRRILERFPMWKQANMQMRATQLMDKRIDGQLSNAEEAERQELKASCAWIDAQRAASDRIEAALPPSSDVAALKAFKASEADWDAPD